MPLMIGIALLILSISLVMVDVAGSFAFRQRLQFFADQLSLEAAADPTQSLEQLAMTLGASIRVPLQSSNLDVQGGDAVVNLCANWQAAVSMPFVPQSSKICVTANAR